MTQLLFAVEQGNGKAADQLLPIVYEELRQLAAVRMAQEKPGQTLQATALVHEAYVRLVNVKRAHRWNSRGHFYCAAAEAMRRILVENDRKKRALKRGGDHRRVQLVDLPISEPPVDVVALDSALDELAERHPKKAQLVTLRYFAGCSLEEAAEILGISRASAQRHWIFARTWLFGRMTRD